jgi:aspartate-semialdehyde dehydrogenase
MKIAVVGATGLVGGVMLKVLEEQQIQFDELIPVASEHSVGKEIEFKGKKYKIVSLQDTVDAKPDIALFSAGGETSKNWAPKFAEVGTFVIDNSSAWRSDKNVPLVVPEVNADEIKENHKIIANPNCSTIQLVMALAPLHRAIGIRRVVVSTYQSVTGSGIKGINQLMNEREGIVGEKAYPHKIDMNILPHGGDFLPNGYTTEEMKLVNETHKILSDNKLAITATVVRVPVKGGHSESVNIEFRRGFMMEEITKLLGVVPGLIILDVPGHNLYPMPSIAEGKDEVFVGRIRKDESVPNAINLWIVADNLRKGAATNAVQIAKYLIQKGFVK